MSLDHVFTMAGSALNAQNVRLSTISQNIANAQTAASSPDTVYRARIPVFQAIIDGQGGSTENGAAVKVVGIVQDDTPPTKQYQPNNPIADENGFIYLPNVNSVEEMSNMMTASRAYQVNIEMMNTAKELMLRTVMLGQ